MGALPGLMFEREKCPHVGMEAVVKFTYCLLSILHSQTYFYFKNFAVFLRYFDDGGSNGDLH